MTKSEDKKFNETLQNLLKTPPKHHEDEKKGDKPPPKKEGGKTKNKGE